MEFTNPHFTPAPEENGPDTPAASSPQEPCSVAAGDKVESMPRLRKVTNSPAREYAARPGVVDSLPDSVAALICSFKGRAEVQRNGIKVERKELSDTPIFYWHEDSRTCLGMQGQKVFYVLNPNTLDCVHVMDAQGRYIETVPRKGLPRILDYDAAKKEIAKHRRYMSRQETRLQELHGEDTKEILQRHRDNTEEMMRATTILPASADAQEATQSEARTPTGDRIAQRGEHVQGVVDDYHRQRASAASLGHATRDEITPRDREVELSAEEDVVEEDLSTPSRATASQTDEVETIESW